MRIGVYKVVFRDDDRSGQQFQLYLEPVTLVNTGPVIRVIAPDYDTWNALVGKVVRMDLEIL